MRLLSPFLSLLLIPFIAVMPLAAELGPSAAPAGSTTPNPGNILKIRLASDVKPNVEASSFVTGYAIVVTDSAGLAVPDAAVAIRLPDEGPSGFFVNGEHAAVAYTDAAGVAKFPQVNWGAIPGSVSIRVTAIKGDLHAGAMIEQTIVAQAPKIPAAVPPVATASSPATRLPNTPMPPPPTGAKLATPAARQPGVPTSVAAVHSGATGDANNPLTPAPVTPPGNQAANPAEPAVSIVNTAGSKGHGSNRKWVILAAVAAGVGAGAALALSGKGGSSAAVAAPTISIGSPTVSLGH